MTGLTGRVARSRPGRWAAAVLCPVLLALLLGMMCPLAPARATEQTAGDAPAAEGEPTAVPADLIPADSAPTGLIADAADFAAPASTRAGSAGSLAQGVVGAAGEDTDPQEISDLEAPAPASPNVDSDSDPGPMPSDQLSSGGELIPSPGESGVPSADVSAASGANSSSTDVSITSDGLIAPGVDSSAPDTSGPIEGDALAGDPQVASAASSDSSADAPVEDEPVADQSDPSGASESGRPLVYGDEGAASLGIALDGRAMGAGEFSFTLDPVGYAGEAGASGASFEQALAKLSGSATHFANVSAQGSGGADYQALLANVSFAPEENGMVYQYILTQDIPAQATNPLLADYPEFADVADKTYGELGGFSWRADHDRAPLRDGYTREDRAKFQAGWQLNGVFYDATHCELFVLVSLGDDGSVAVDYQIMGYVNRVDAQSGEAVSDLLILSFTDAEGSGNLEGALTFRNAYLGEEHAVETTLGELLPLSIGVSLEGVGVQEGQFGFTLDPREPLPGEVGVDAAAKLTVADAHPVSGASDGVATMPLLAGFAVGPQDAGTAYMYTLTQDIPDDATNPVLNLVFPLFYGMTFGELEELAVSGDTLQERIDAANALSMDGWHAGGIVYDARRCSVSVVVSEADPSQLSVRVTAYRYAQGADGDWGLVRDEQLFSTGGGAPQGPVVVFENRPLATSAGGTLSYAEQGGLKVATTLTGRDAQAGEFTYAIVAYPHDGELGGMISTSAEEAAAKLSDDDRTFATERGGPDGVAQIMAKLKSATFTMEDVGKTYQYVLYQVVPDDATNPLLAGSAEFSQFANAAYGSLGESSWTRPGSEITQEDKAQMAPGWQLDGVTYDTTPYSITVTVCYDRDRGVWTHTFTMGLTPFINQETGGLEFTQKLASYVSVAGATSPGDDQALSFTNSYVAPEPAQIAYAGLSVDLRYGPLVGRDETFPFAIAADEAAPNAADADARLADADRSFVNDLPGDEDYISSTVRLSGLRFGPQDVGSTFTYLVSLVDEERPGYRLGGGVASVAIEVKADEDGSLYTLTQVTQDGKVRPVVDGRLEEGPVSGAWFSVGYEAKFDESTAPVVVARNELTGRDQVAGEFTFGITTSDEIPGTVEPMATATNAADGTVTFSAFSPLLNATWLYIATTMGDSAEEIVTEDGLRAWTVWFTAYQDADVPENVTTEVDTVDFMIAFVDNGDGTLSPSIGYPEGGIVFKNAYAEPVQPDPDPEPEPTPDPPAPVDPEEPSQPENPAQPTTPAQPDAGEKPSSSKNPEAVRPAKPQIPATGDSGVPSLAQVASALGVGTVCVVAAGALLARSWRRRTSRR